MASVTRAAGPRSRPGRGREHQRVVRLRDAVGRSAVLHWRERAAGRDQRPPVGPADQVVRHRLRLEVGLDSGMMIGRSTVDAICRTIGSVNAPAWVEVPISIVGCTLATTSASPYPVLPRGGPRRHLAAWPGVGHLEVEQLGGVLSQQALDAQCPDSASGFLRRALHAPSGRASCPRCRFRRCPRRE